MGGGGLMTTISYNFKDKLKLSQGVKLDSDPETIKALIPGCIEVVKSNLELDIKGVDFIATLRKGATLNIDIKTREKGCSKFWKYSIPELALELWSVVPTLFYPSGSPGWTLSESSITDLVLFTFDKSDTDKCYLIPFQHLRIAFRFKLNDWIKDYTGLKYQDTENKYRSACIFVPANVVITSIMDVCECKFTNLS